MKPCSTLLDAWTPLWGPLLTETGLTDHGECLTQGTVLWERWRWAECGPWARLEDLVLTLIHRTAPKGLSGGEVLPLVSGISP